MRIAVVADIHGNLRALEAVQADLLKHSPDVIVNLGDNLSGPLQAAETANFLMQQTYPQIRGNHDRQLLDRPPEKMGLSDRAAFEQLSSRHKAWLADLPAAQTLGEDILLCHGSPDDDLKYLLEDVVGDGVRLGSPDRIQNRLGTTSYRLVLCGHSHLPRTVLLPGGIWIVNPGSVGLPAYDDTWTALHYVEAGSPHARYAIIDRDRLSFRVNLVAVDYDWDAASKEAARANRPDWACALATGFALRP